MARGSRGEDLLAGLPVIGPLSGARTRDDRALIRKQEQMAEDAARRQKRMEQARLNAMNQTMGAFAPRNQVMAQMFGPEAAFTGQQMGDMTANPIPAETDPSKEMRRDDGNMSLEQYMQQRMPGWTQEGTRRGEFDRGQVQRHRGEYAELQRYLEQQRAGEETERQRRAKLDQQFATQQSPDPFRKIQPAPGRSR